jgi:hypothetical protein
MTTLMAEMYLSVTQPNIETNISSILCPGTLAESSFNKPFWPNEKDKPPTDDTG